MKKNLYIIIAAVFAAMTTSCANTYQFCQICETKPVKQDHHLKSDEEGLHYENDQCIIDYCFWSNGGTADFSFFNKTDEIIYVDLAESFYILNGKAYDIRHGQELTQSISLSTTFSGNQSRNIVPSSNISEPTNAKDETEANAVFSREKKIVAIPPHSKKHIKAYNIIFSPILSCDLKRYPSKSARLGFTADNSPYRFSDYITYTVGSSTQQTVINNEFYVSSVTNYAEPEIIVMEKRDEICENMRDPDYVSPSRELYDKVVKDDICETASSFYTTYNTTSTEKVYDNSLSQEYTYDQNYNAYIKQSAVSGRGIVGIIAVIAAVTLGIILMQL